MPGHLSGDFGTFHMVGRSKPATKAEKERLQKLHELPCVCCHMRGIGQPFPTEAHHLINGGRRRGHMESIPACRWHHRSWCLPNTDIAEMTEKYGPSLALGSTSFHAVFGSDNELLERTNEMLQVIP